MSKILGIIIKFREIVFTLATLSVLGFGTWLTLKLIPVNQSLDQLKFRANAQEIDISELKTAVFNLQTDTTLIKQDTSFIRGVLSK